MKFLKTSLVLACGFAFSVTANAAYLGIEDTSGPEQSFQLDSDNHFSDTGKIPELAVNTTVDQSKKVVATSDDRFKLTFTFLGYEAGYDNFFEYKDEELFNTKDYDRFDTYSDSRSFIYDDGEGDLSFLFGTLDDDEDEVKNADNSADVDFDFFTYSPEDDVIFLGLDDGGAQDDDNHDDMIMKVTASKVPEPGTLALLGLGLAGLGMSYRRRS